MPAQVLTLALAACGKNTASKGGGALSFEFMEEPRTSLELVKRLGEPDSTSETTYNPHHLFL